MKNTLTVLFIAFFLNGLNAQNSNPSYDSTLAKQLDADQYGMKMYVLVILKTGKNKTKNKKLKNTHPQTVPPARDPLPAAV